jgi:microcin C transport system substrate-binding protein
VSTPLPQPRRPRLAAALAAAVIGVALLHGAAPSAAQRTTTEPGPRHGLSVFGDLKYKPGFKHFDYVDPDAPKGGTLRLHGIDSFDTLNPYILKGAKAAGLGLLFDTLMARAMDEPDALYGLVARSVTLAPDRSWVAFDLRPEARFHDGTPVTADDVVFTFNALVKDGDPVYRIVYRDVAGAEKTGRLRVKFTFKPGRHRDLPTRLAALPVLSKAYYRTVRFKKTTMAAPLGSGPYRIGKVAAGRSISYRRDPGYWARDLAVNRGRHNFDMVRFDYYRDRDIAFQAFFAGAYDYREEFTSRSWATQYDKPAVRKRLIVRETLPDETPSGAQVFVFNLRRGKFKDWRVRAAFDLAFDFEWTNKNLFYGLYERTNSLFENSVMAAKKPPGKAELALLEPLRGQVPEQVFTTPYASPVTDGSGRIRGNLRKATRLLEAAGWKVRNGVLVNAKGEKLSAEFLLSEATFQRIIGPYIRNLKRLGIGASIRIVDVANFKYRVDHYDFGVIVERYVQSLTPGIEQRNYFGSAYANVPGSRNLSGIADPAVDTLVEKVIGAASRPALVAAVRALDRILMWNRYTVPQWYKGEHNIAYWNKFERPRVKARFSIGLVDTWWFNPAKAKMIEAGTAPGSN